MTQTDSAMAPKHATIRELFVINTYWVGLSIMWNSLHPLILPAMLLNLVPETRKNTYLGLLTFAGLVIAMIVQPISGAVSDRWHSRWGRRRPFILAGTLVDFIFLAIIGWAGGLFWLVIGYIGLQFSSNIAHGPAQGLLPDRVPPEQLGMGSAIKNLLDMAGLIVASLLAGRLMDPQGRNPTVIMLVVILVLAAMATITLVFTREAPTGTRNSSASKESLRDLLHVDFRAHTAYWWLILARFAFLLGVYGVQSFAEYYVRDVLEVANPVLATGNLLAAVTLALLVFLMAGGWLSDRIGTRWVMAAASLLAALGCLLLMTARTPAQLVIYGSILGMGIGLFLTSNWTVASRLAPVEDAGKFLGLTNLATAGAGALGRLTGPLIDLFNNMSPGAHLGYTFLFLLGAVSSLAVLPLLGWIYRGSGSEKAAQAARTQ